MNCTLTIVRYPKYLGFAGFLSMALFRLPLAFNKRIGFWKLLGCGKNGSFDIHPDWRQWGVLTVSSHQSPVSRLNKSYKQPITNHPHIYGSLIAGWYKFFGCEVWTILLEPIEGHGTWDGKEAFGTLPKQTDYKGLIAVLTRATIRLNKLKSFWQNVEGVAAKTDEAPGFITSIGIGEVPFIKQATFSIWQSKEHMKQFAYRMQEHAEVIRKTKKENWYSEDMFVRFKPIATFGTLNGTNPLEGKL